MADHDLIDRRDAVSHNAFLARRIKELEQTILAKDCVIELSGERIKELEAALRPFSHAEWRTAYGGNIEGDASIVMQRNEAKLTLGDFRRANKALNRKEEK